jgi:hypothetical protein
MGRLWVEVESEGKNFRWEWIEFLTKLVIR